MNETTLHPRQALLLAFQTSDHTSAETEESLDELQELARSAGLEVLDRLTQAREKMDPGHVFGAGKVTEIKRKIGELGADTAIFDGNLAPSQGRHLEKALGVLLLDRTQLILDIFHRNARTREAHMQVELAQLEYMLPRLVGLWAHLDRERGGIAGSKGAGEKQIDLDRTIVRNRIARLKKDLKHVAQERATQKKRRQDNCFRVSLVGYTNAGKTTLMNRLTDARQLAEDRLFATLDSTTRVMSESMRPKILLSDTVGFIRRLPHELVASFRSTLEVARDADLLLHVVDLHQDTWEEHIAITEKVLEEIEAHQVPRLLVFNKVDRVEDRVRKMLAQHKFPEAVFTSAAQDDPAQMREHIVRFFEKAMITTPLLLEYADYGELSKIYRWSRVDEVRYEQDGIHLLVTSTPANLERIRAIVPVEESQPTPGAP
ncbi:MAG: GTPase HflX [Deltaproteobacteria bacterium]|nr:GTPase HflX [Deltaproteobacteria bacterium]